MVDCTPIDINGESHGMTTYSLDDRGGNRCGCGAEEQDCNLDINAIASHAAGAFNHHGVLTFAVGLQGSNEAKIIAE